MIGKVKRILKITAIVIGVILLLLAGGIVYLTVREYRPEAVEKVNPGSGVRTLAEGEALTVLTFNTGYAGLSRNEDFFMDGGSKVKPESRELVEENLRGISAILELHDADVCFLQEVDRNSSRSYHIDEQAYYEETLGLTGMFGCNYKCDFVPYPLPPIGKVNSGLVTFTDYGVSEASRISLPESFSWPVKTCNLKRCMLEARIPVEGTDRELVLINFHLEAYDSGEGKEAQSRILAEKLKEEYDKGNYVIAGGDFNQTFEMIDGYPIHNQEDWVPGVIGQADLPAGFTFAVSDNVPTCRLLNAPYSGNYQDSQVYVLDGFIVSDNLEVSRIENIDTDFQYTDHQPALLKVKLK